MVALISVMITGDLQPTSYNGAKVLIHWRCDADSATLDQVAVLRSYVNIVSITGRSLGYPLGGLLADTVGWRW
jgi:hypothetical protein